MDDGRRKVYNVPKGRGRRPVKITQELAQRIAGLARLTLPEEEKARMSAQLEDVLGRVTALDRLRLEEEPSEQRGEER